MVQPGQAIQYADLQALATLANQKLRPATPYAFTAFAGSDRIAVATNLKAKAHPGFGNFTVGTKITLWLYSYKTIAGVKTYSYEREQLAFYSDNLTQPFLLDYTWESATDATAPDGYIAVVPMGSNLTVVSGEWEFLWKDLGNVTALGISDPNFGGWNFDFSLIPGALLGPVLGVPSVDVPCAHGTWLKTLNTIWHDCMAQLDIFGGPVNSTETVLGLSGPWIVSAGPKLYLNKNGKPIYTDIQFINSIHDSATGNRLSAEADMGTDGAAAFFTSGQNGANTYAWDANGTLNGTITLLSTFPGQSSADWTLSASDPSITTSINPDVVDFFGNFVTGLVFTFNNTPITAGTPITLTATALTGGTIQGAVGAQIAAVFTGTPQTIHAPFSGPGAAVIHPAGTESQQTDLANVLPALNLTANGGGPIAFEAHWRAYSNGVFVANTLPTQGIMPFVDVDLPNYSLPGGSFQGGFGNGSRQRVPKNPALASYLPTVDNSPSLWPVLGLADFTPDEFFGGPYKGSNAWRQFATRTVGHSPFILNPVTVPANGFVAGNLEIITTVAFVQELRLLVDSAEVQMYVKFGTPPTQGDFDAILPGGQWNTLTPASAGWIDGAPVFVGFFNLTGGELVVNAYEIEIDSIAAPNGFFFAGQIADDGTLMPALEGESYTFDDPLDLSTRPIPLFGYSIFNITICRIPGSDNSQSVDVDIGVMAGMGWNAAGNFEVIESFTIPAGEDFVSEPVFIPVLGGTPLAQSSSGELIIAAATNFQPMMHSGFSLQQLQKSVQGLPGTFDVGYYDGRPFLNPGYALLFPDEGFIGALGVVLPLCSATFNDLMDMLNQFSNP